MNSNQIQTSSSNNNDKSSNGRHQFKYKGQLIYEWDQSLDEVNIYIHPPKGIKGSMLSIIIESQHLTVGIKGNPPFIDEDIMHLVNASDSLWTYIDNEIQIQLYKSQPGKTWLGVLKGHVLLDAKQQREASKDILLERFQREHPGFDLVKHKLMVMYLMLQLLWVDYQELSS